jgi:hypothetical protein
MKLMIMFLFIIITKKDEFTLKMVIKNNFEKLITELKLKVGKNFADSSIGKH